MITDARLAKARKIAAQMRQLQLDLESLQLSDEEQGGLDVPAVPQISVKREQSFEARPGITRRPLKSAREQVLSALQEVGLPMLSRDVQHYLRARYGVGIDATRFGSLRKAEMEAFDRGSQRSVWLGYGLTESGEAVKRLLARSDFTLQERVVGPFSGRRLFFATTARFCEIALHEWDRIEDFEAFSIFVADHARDLPGLKHFQKGQFPFAEWLEKAYEALAGIAERDLLDRRHIAMRLTMLADKDRLFGTEFSAEDRSIDPPITAETLAR